MGIKKDQGRQAAIEQVKKWYWRSDRPLAAYSGVDAWDTLAHMARMEPDTSQANYYRQASWSEEKSFKAAWEKMTSAQTPVLSSVDEAMRRKAIITIQRWCKNAGLLRPHLRGEGAWFILGNIANIERDETLLQYYRQASRSEEKSFKAAWEGEA